MLEPKGGVHYPPIDSGVYLLDYFFEVGPVMHVGEGIAPISWQEIESWQNGTYLELPPWEVLALRRLSIEFAREAARAKDPKRPAPWQTKEIDQDSVSIGIEKAFMAFAKNQEARKKGRR